MMEFVQNPRRRLGLSLRGDMGMPIGLRGMALTLGRYNRRPIFQVYEERSWRDLIRISGSNKEDFRWRSLRDLVKSYVKGIRVLDAGCGTGHMALDLLKSGYEVTAIDVSPQLVDFAHSLIDKEGSKLM